MNKHCVRDRHDGLYTLFGKSIMVMSTNTSKTVHLTKVREMVGKFLDREGLRGPGTWLHTESWREWSHDLSRQFEI